MIDQQILLEWIKEQIDFEKRMFASCQNINSPGACMALGAQDAYARVVEFIESEYKDD